MDIDDKNLVAFGEAVRRQRKHLRLSLRELGQRIGLSASYLSSIECGRNPTTGRPPQPSAGAVDHLCEILGLNRAAVFSQNTGQSACYEGCDHILLYRLDEKRDGLEELSAKIANGRVTNWLCIVDPNTKAEPTDSFHAWSWPYRSGPYPGEYLEVGRIVDALASHAEGFREAVGTESYGLIIADCSSVMRWVVNPDAEVEFEDEWCQQSGDALKATFGHEPVINMCVYHQMDFEAMSQRMDRLNALLRLFDTHGSIAAVRQDGTIVEGEQAILEILRENRPTGISGAAWRAISVALAIRHLEKAPPLRNLSPRGAPERVAE